MDVLRIIYKKAYIIALVLMAFLPSLGFAQSEIAPAEKRSCGSSCLYQKGNENLSLQALYFINNIRTVQTLRVKNEKQELKSFLGSFCASNEKVELCSKRFERVQILSLYKINAAIVQNNDAIGRLAEKKLGDNAPAVQSGIDESALKPVTPDFFTYDELKQKYEMESYKLDLLTDVEYMEWVKQFVTAKPTLDSFIKFKTIPRDPNDPKSEKIHILDQSCGLSRCYDLKAYQQALQAFQGSEQVMKTDLESMIGRFEKNKKLIDRTTNISEEAVNDYNQARGMMIKSVNESIQKESSKNNNLFVSKQNRKIANQSQETVQIADGVYKQEFSGKEKVVEQPSNKESKNIYISWSPTELESVINEMSAEVFPNQE